MVRFVAPLVAALTAATCTALLGAAPAAAAYPERSIVLMVPFVAGGSTDLVARIVAEHMAKTLGQSIVIENDAGAGGTLVTRRAAQAAPDGYTLVMGTMGTHGAAPAQYPNLKYDPVKDFTPIGLTAGLPAVIVARKDFPAATLTEFIAYVKGNPDKVNEAHAGVGSQMHTFCTLLHSVAGTKPGRVAYRGGGAAINDLVGGQVDFACFPLMTVVSQINGGTIKAIAIASPERADVIKDVPTTKEAGLPAFQVTSWNAIFAPRGLPREIQAKLTEAVDKALDDANTRKRLLELGCEVPDKAARTPEALQQLVEREVARWDPVLKGAAAAAAK
jgi:tripartite-type tricarboxylate transporter receptor subunit TctC